MKVPNITGEGLLVALAIVAAVVAIALGIQGNLAVTQDTNETREGIVVACASAPEGEVAECIDAGRDLLSEP